MKRRLILLAAVVALLAGFGALLHSPPERRALYVCDEDYALIRYAEKLCKSLQEMGLDIQVKEWILMFFRSKEQLL